MKTYGRIIGAGAIIVACVCLMLVQVPVSDAQYGCRTQYNYGYNYNYQTYQTPVVVKKEVIKEYIPVAIPTSYPVVAVPVYSYVNAPGYYPGAYYGQGSVLQQPQQAMQQNNLDADKIADLVMQRLEKKLRLTPDTTIPDTGPEGPPTIIKSNGKKNGNAAKAIPLMQTKCASCHSGAASAGGGVSLFDSNKQLKTLTADARIAVYDAVYEGRMPKGGSALSDQDVEFVRLWMKQK